MPHYDFNKDLPVSEKNENDIAVLIKDLFGERAKNIKYGYDNKWDLSITIDGKPITFEIKEDFSCKRTGNIGVEYSCRGKLSGISVSQADFYIYAIHLPNSGKIDYRIIKTAVLKDIIEQKEYFRSVNGGDPGSNSLNYLFKLNVFNRHSGSLTNVYNSIIDEDPEPFMKLQAFLGLQPKAPN